MGMRQYYYVVLGAAIPESEFPGDLWDERWLPYYEGHEGVEFSILQGGEGSSNIYVGKVLAESDPYEDWEYKEMMPTAGDIVSTSDWLKENFGYMDVPKFLFVCRWS